MAPLQPPRLDDPGLDQTLAAIPRLVDLDPSENLKLGDEGLRNLSKSASLMKLNVADTSVNDVGIVHLVALASLVILEVDTERITEASLQPLRRLRPSLLVHDPRKPLNQRISLWTAQLW